MVTAEDGCSHAPLHLPSIAQPHSTSPHYITCHHSSNTCAGICVFPTTTEDTEYLNMLEDFFLPWFQLSAVSFCCLEAGVTDEKSEAHCIPLLLVHPSLGRAWSRVPGQISLQPPLPVINQSRCRQPRPRPEDGDGGWRMLPQPDM